MAEEGTGEPPVVHTYDGHAVDVLWNAARCLHFAECIRRLPSVFDTSNRPWVQPDRDGAYEVISAVEACPSGALQYIARHHGPELGDVPTTISMNQRRQISIRGDLVVRTPSGAESHETRIVACGCGRSAAAPLCDNSCPPATATATIREESPMPEQHREEGAA